MKSVTKCINCTDNGCTGEELVCFKELTYPERVAIIVTLFWVACCLAGAAWSLYIG